ncbi:unnamed protein product [Amoebophrya sp. A120]|nr:unnamed protein product [Amoebophrya sp. A120]|eukprot:GSA120T00020087001.1
MRMRTLTRTPMLLRRKLVALSFGGLSCSFPSYLCRSVVHRGPQEGEQRADEVHSNYQDSTYYSEEADGEAEGDDYVDNASKLTAVVDAFGEVVAQEQDEKSFADHDDDIVKTASAFTEKTARTGHSTSGNVVHGASPASNATSTTSSNQATSAAAAPPPAPEHQQEALMTSSGAPRPQESSEQGKEQDGQHDQQNGVTVSPSPNERGWVQQLREAAPAVVHEQVSNRASAKSAQQQQHGQDQENADHKQYEYVTLPPDNHMLNEGASRQIRRQEERRAAAAQDDEPASSSGTAPLGDENSGMHLWNRYAMPLASAIRNYNTTAGGADPSADVDTINMARRSGQHGADQALDEARSVVNTTELRGQGHQLHDAIYDSSLGQRLLAVGHTVAGPNRQESSSREGFQNGTRSALDIFVDQMNSTNSSAAMTRDLVDMLGLGRDTASSLNKSEMEMVVGLMRHQMRDPSTVSLFKSLLKDHKRAKMVKMFANYSFDECDLFPSSMMTKDPVVNCGKYAFYICMALLLVCFGMYVVTLGSCLLPVSESRGKDLYKGTRTKWAFWTDFVTEEGRARLRSEQEEAEKETEATPPSWIALENVSFRVQAPPDASGRPRELDLLSDINCVFRSGEVAAILGSSGCGKTTLLNALSGRVQWKQAGGESGRLGLSGRILLNGEPTSDLELQRIAGYVYQDDQLIATETVFECVDFAAAMRLPHLNVEARVKKVHDVLRELRLDVCKDVIIGDGMGKKGISGGQKRRTSAALEIIGQPLILLMDEPTSGLDSFTATIFIREMRNLAKAINVMIICTIHQPGTDCFDEFDRALIMCKGKLVFHGKGEYYGKRLRGQGHDITEKSTVLSRVVLRDSAAASQQQQQQLLQLNPLRDSESYDLDVTSLTSEEEEQLSIGDYARFHERRVSAMSATSATASPAALANVEEDASPTSSGQQQLPKEEPLKWTLRENILKVAEVALGPGENMSERALFITQTIAEDKENGMAELTRLANMTYENGYDPEALERMVETAKRQTDANMFESDEGEEGGDENTSGGKSSGVFRDRWSKGSVFTRERRRAWMKQMFARTEHVRQIAPNRRTAWHVLGLFKREMRIRLVSGWRTEVVTYIAVLIMDFMLAMLIPPYYHTKTGEGVLREHASGVSVMANWFGMMIGMRTVTSMVFMYPPLWIWCMTEMVFYVKINPVFQREYSGHTYQSIAYSFSKFCMEAMLFVPRVIFQVCVGYLLQGYYGNLPYLGAIMYLLLLQVCSQFYFVVALVSSNALLGFAAAAALLITQIMMSGTVPMPIPWFYRPFQWSSGYFYCFTAVYRDQLRGLRERVHDFSNSTCTITTSTTESPYVVDDEDYDVEKDGQERLQGGLNESMKDIDSVPRLQHDAGSGGSLPLVDPSNRTDLVQEAQRGEQGAAPGETRVPALPAQQAVATPGADSTAATTQQPQGDFSTFHASTLANGVQQAFAGAAPFAKPGASSWSPDHQVPSVFGGGSPGAPAPAAFQPGAAAPGDVGGPAGGSSSSPAAPSNTPHTWDFTAVPTISGATGSSSSTSSWSSFLLSSNASVSEEDVGQEATSETSPSLSSLDASTAANMTTAGGALDNYTDANATSNYTNHAWAEAKIKDLFWNDPDTAKCSLQVQSSVGEVTEELEALIMAEAPGGTLETVGFNEVCGLALSLLVWRGLAWYFIHKMGKYSVSS